MLKKYSLPSILLCIVLFIAFPVCVSYQIVDPFVTPRLVLLSATVIILFLFYFFGPRNQSAINVNLPLISFLAFLFLYGISITKSINPGDAWFEWMKTFLALPVMLLVAILFKKDEERKILLKFSQVGMLILSSVYFYQWVDFLNNRNLEFVFDTRLHIASTLGNKNFYAEVIALMLPFSVIGFFSLEKYWKWLSLFNIIILIVSILTTQSYAALAAIGVAGLVVGVVYFSSRSENKISGLKLAAITTLVILVSGFIVFKSGVFSSFNKRLETVSNYLLHPELMDSTAKSNSNSTFERVMLWKNSYGLIKENPLTGSGAGNWKLLYPKFGIGGTRYIEGGNVHYEHPHNDYLLIASESGISALIAFLIFFISVIWIALKKMKSKRQERLWYAGILFAIICIMLVSIFSFPRMRFYAWILMAVYIGILMAVDNGDKIRMKFSKAGWKLMLLTCAVISVFSLTAGLVKYSGEVHSKILQIAKKQRNFARVVRESEKAASWIFPVDESATPFTWYKGMALFYSGDVSGAKISFEDALQKNPYHIQLLNDLATAYEQTNERERAIGLYRRALSVTPYFPQSLLNISACYFNINKKDSAFFFIDKLYGIKLTSQDKRSYDAYLPAILREKIFSAMDKFPEDFREKATVFATDTSFVKTAYTHSKTANVPFLEVLSDSLRMRLKP